MTANSSRLARHPGLPQLTCIAVVVPLAEYRQLRHALEEQQVNEEFDAGQADFLARRNSGALCYVCHEKAARRLGLPVQ